MARRFSQDDNGNVTVEVLDSEGNVQYTSYFQPKSEQTKGDDNE